MAYSLVGLGADIHQIDEGALHFAMVVDDMDLRRSDVQRFLTDVAASHERDGFKMPKNR